MGRITVQMQLGQPWRLSIFHTTSPNAPCSSSNLPRREHYAANSLTNSLEILLPEPERHRTYVMLHEEGYVCAGRRKDTGVLAGNGARKAVV
jgi:hypothetical protein